MENDYISRQAAIDSCYDGYADCRDDCADNIRNLPPADVRPVVHAEWILLDGGKGKCPVCEFVQEAVWDYDHTQHFCGVCGADMREQEEKPKDPFEGWSEELKATFSKLLASLNLEGGDA